MRYAKRVIAAVAAILIAGSMIPATAQAYAVPDPRPIQLVVHAPKISHESREEAAAKSARANSNRGFKPSLYQGRYYHADQEWFRKCVGLREGSFVYTVRGGGGGNYFGTYQFHRNFQRGAAYMMANESKRTHDGLRHVALELRDVPINKWGRYWQDRAFYTVLNWNGKWAGKGHWAGGRWHC